ncbi:cytochrome P450 [Trujillonella humicola]|uniref:cytochrome P450 n=1 Tax=Trujillonella humicola TaxID=3383699 RepID=UPI003905ED18
MTARETTLVPATGVLDGARTLATVLLPVAVRGAIVRRPRAVALAERMDADTRAVRWMQRLRDRYGPGPVRIRVPGRQLTVVLSPDHVHRVLAETPRPFSAATREKRAALAHFQPEGLLISAPEERAHRRPFNEAVLDAGAPLHRLAGPMSRAAREEAGALLAEADRTGALTWDAYAAAWWRTVRRVVLGDAARDDEAVTDDLLHLRRRANYSFLAPSAPRVRRRFLRRLAGYVEAAEPGSLAALVAGTPAHPNTVPHQQIPQWLFAFDAMSWASARALALLAAHPDAADRARAELPGAPDLPFLRATLLESLRLWPTTPAILRDTTEETSWEAGVLPAGASVLVFAPFFHRDETRLPEAHRFTPGLWERERTADDWPLVPFSAGPGMCPGRNTVLLTASVFLAALVEDTDWRPAGDALDPDRPMPGTLSPFRLRFEPRRTPGSSG